MSAGRLWRTVRHMLIFVAVIAAMSAVGIWLDLGAVVE
jgi:hypothetical protein